MGHLYLDEVIALFRSQVVARVAWERHVEAA